jgi:hypothetical protein
MKDIEFDISMTTFLIRRKLIAGEENIEMLHRFNRERLLKRKLTPKK